MKCVILLSLVALSYAGPYGLGMGKNVTIAEDGTIVITEASGKRVVISKAIGSVGQKNIDISISGPNIPFKRIQIDELNDVRSIYDSNQNVDSEIYENNELGRDKRGSKDNKKIIPQADILTDILKQYQGAVDEKSYDKLLKKINNAVESGELDKSIYDILKTFDIQPQQNVLTGLPRQGSGTYLQNRPLIQTPNIKPYGTQADYWQALLQSYQRRLALEQEEKQRQLYDSQQVPLNVQYQTRLVPQILSEQPQLGRQQLGIQWGQSGEQQRYGQVVDFDPTEVLQSQRDVIQQQQQLRQLQQPILLNQQQLKSLQGLQQQQLTPQQILSGQQQVLPWQQQQQQSLPGQQLLAPLAWKQQSWVEKEQQLPWTNQQQLPWVSQQTLPWQQQQQQTLPWQSQQTLPWQQRQTIPWQQRQTLPWQQQQILSGQQQQILPWEQQQTLSSQQQEQLPWEQQQQVAWQQLPLQQQQELSLQQLQDKNILQQPQFSRQVGVLERQQPLSGQQLIWKQPLQQLLQAQLKNINPRQWTVYPQYKQYGELDGQNVPQQLYRPVSFPLVY